MQLSWKHSIPGAFLMSFTRFWRAMTAPVSADFIGMADQPQETGPSAIRAEPEEAGFADGYRWLHF
jgi:hypothetical protein